jgi:CHAT domain-containing protein
VTLSACDTGVGPVGEEGVANVVNAFVEAGAQTVVSTLWELEDHSTAHLMTVFYEHLGRAEEKGESLREAQLQMIASGDPPYFWAGFEVVGDPTGNLFNRPNQNSTVRRTQ